MPQTPKLFHEELDQLHADAVRLAAMASESIQAGTACLLDFDLSAAKAVIAGDKVLDDLTHSIEERTYLLLARQQPMAVDLRMLVTTLRIIHELERIGDLMVNVAKGARRLYPGPLDPKVRGIIDRMRSQATAQLQLATDTFAERDPAKASALGTWTTSWTTSRRSCTAPSSRPAPTRSPSCSGRCRSPCSAGTSSASPTTR